MPRKKPSISGVFLTSMVVLTVTAMISMGVLLVAQQVDVFRHELETLHSQSLDAQKTLLKSEVERTMGFISFLREATEKHFRQELRNRGEEAYAVAAAMDRARGAARGRAEAEGTAIEILRSWPLRRVSFSFRRGPAGTHPPLQPVPAAAGGTPHGLIASSSGGKRQGFSTGDWLAQGAALAEGTSYARFFEPFGWIIGVRAAAKDMEDRPPA